MDLSTLADLVAAAAIVVSLGLVVHEMRQTRRQAELGNWRDLLQTLVDFKAATNDLAFADLVRRGHADYGGLTETEKLAFGLYLEQGVHVLGNFVKHNDALPSRLKGLDLAIVNLFHDLLATPGGAAWWAEARQAGRFMPETYVVTEALLEKRRANGGRPLTG